MNKIPTHDPQTGELNPYYEELTGEKNPLSSDDKFDNLTWTLNYWKNRRVEEEKIMKERGTNEWTNEMVRINWNIKESKKILEAYNPKRVSNKVFLIDIDGTVCDDIKNEESHLYDTAKVIPGAKEMLNKWYYEGNIITFFTAREEKDRGVTTQWLRNNGFKYHKLVMDKPRIKDGQEYVWIDNRKVRAVTYLGTWGELKEVDAKIQTF